MSQFRCLNGNDSFLKKVGCSCQNVLIQQNGETGNIVIGTLNVFCATLVLFLVFLWSRKAKRQMDKRAASVTILPLYFKVNFFFFSIPSSSIQLLIELVFNCHCDLSSFIWNL